MNFAQKKVLSVAAGLASIVFTIVSVCTATYAWFAMNNTVSATGMSVRCKESDAPINLTYDVLKFNDDTKLGVSFGQTPTAIELPEYDSYISKKNEYANVILRFEATFSEGLATTDYVAFDIDCSAELFRTFNDTTYIDDQTSNVIQFKSVIYSYTFVDETTPPSEILTASITDTFSETPANNPDYVWVLKDSPSSVGISSLSSGGGTKTVRFYSPEYQTYLYCAEGGSASSPEDPTMVSDYSSATAFTIDGPNSNIQFGGGTYSFINNGGIGGGVPNSVYRAVPFHFSGGVTTVEEDPSAKTYDLVTDVTGFVAGETYAFAYGTNGSIKAMSATQMTNNRVAIVASASNGVLSYVSDLGEFELVGDSCGWSFKDVKNSTESTTYYLCTPTNSSNRLTISSTLGNTTKYTLTEDSSDQFIVENLAYTNRFIAFNTREGTNGFLFSSYTLSSGETEYIHFY